MCLNFVSFLISEMSQVLENVTLVRHGPLYPVYMINIMAADDLVTRGTIASVLLLGQDIFCLKKLRHLKNLCSFVKKINAVVHAQFTFQILTLQTKISYMVNTMAALKDFMRDTLVTKLLHNIYLWCQYQSHKCSSGTLLQSMEHYEILQT